MAHQTNTYENYRFHGILWVQMACEFVEFLFVDSGPEPDVVLRSVVPFFT